MMKKIVAGVVSLILVVGVVLGVVAGINRRNTSSEEASPSMKAVASICNPTDFKDACISTLKTVAQNATATPKDFIQAAVKATMDEMKNSFTLSSTLVNTTDNPTTKRALSDCKELLDFAVQELQSSFSMVGGSELRTVADRSFDLRTWLSAVISYKETCLDGLDDPKFKKAMQEGLLNATQLTSNALAIATEIADILQQFNVKIDFKQPSSSSRRLLADFEMGSDGLPQWVGHGDRRLLQQAGTPRVTPNVVVAKDGSGKFKTINEALASYPKNFKGRYVIYVKAGVYQEYVVVNKDQANVFMYGDGPRKTIVTGDRCNAKGWGTYQSATFAVVGEGFIGKSMGFANTAGPAGHQAVALRVQGDMAVFYNCRMDGYQDTLYTQAKRQFYRNCVISGTVDYIFGDASAVIQNSLLIVRKPGDNQKNAVTAQGRAEKRELTGIVIHNCRIVPEQKLFPVRFTVPTYLGRPWKEYSRTIIMESTLGDFIQPAGWMEWQGNFALDTLFYREYGNRGPGAKVDQRVKWGGYKAVTDRREVLPFTTGPFLAGESWLKAAEVPYLLGLRY